MTRHRSTNPDQLALDWESDPAIQQRIEELVSERVEVQAYWWRLRLILIETVTLGALVIASGMALGQPTFMVVRSGLFVAAACFASGMILIGLTALSSSALSRFQRWRAR